MSSPGTFTYFQDSTAVTTPTPPTFKGLWLHYPSNAQATSTNFLYGKNERSHETELENTELKFAGREFRVVEFGEHRDDSFSCGVKIPHGPNYYAERDALRLFANSRTTVVARDNRGHVVFGAITGLSESHDDDGSMFTFEVLRVHREIWEII